MIYMLYTNNTEGASIYSLALHVVLIALDLKEVVLMYVEYMVRDIHPVN